VYQIIAIVLVIAGLSGCGSKLEAPSELVPVAIEATAAESISESQQLKLWLNERNEELLQMSPIRMAGLGRKDKYNQIDDYSEAAEQKQLLWREKTVEDLQANIKYDALTRDAKISYDVWVYQYETATKMAPYRRHRYLFNQMRDAHSSLPNFLINSHTVKNETEMRA